jgi:hypothetical protein
LSSHFFNFSTHTFSEEERRETNILPASHHGLKQQRTTTTTATMTDIKQRFQSFIAEHPQGSFEEWIGALYPEKMHESLLLEGFLGAIDAKFYEQDSEHRQLWNQNLGDARSVVPPTTRGGGDADSEDGAAVGVIDFLSDSESVEGGEPTVVVLAPPPRAEAAPAGQDLLSFD